MIKVKLPMQRLVELLSKPSTTVYFAREIAEMLVEYEKHEIGTAYLHGYKDAIKWVEEGSDFNKKISHIEYLEKTYENN